MFVVWLDGDSILKIFQESGYETSLEGCASDFQSTQDSYMLRGGGQSGYNLLNFCSKNFIRKITTESSPVDNFTKILVCS